MKNLILVCVVAFAFSTTAMAADIAISTQAGWFGQAAADREMQEIVDNVTTVSVEQFTADQQDALADWVVAHTGNGESDLLIVCGQFPDTIYPAGNAQPDGSLAELFLDDGNTIVNTGDWIFYVVNSTGANGPSGLQNMMDIPGVTVAGEDNTAVTLTSEGRAVAPSLQDFQTDRPFHLDTLEGDWVPELILAQNDAGTRADPVIVVNTVTGGRIGIFFQTASQDNDPRGEVISEWINNFVLTGGEIPNSTAWKPNPADGTIDADVASLEWTAGYGAVSHNVYLSTDATIDDADLAAEETDMEMHFAVLTPGATYYWRIDEVDADGNVTEGDVWSFSTLPLEAHFPSPADGATNAISLELSWTPGKNTIMHNVHFGTDPAALVAVSMMQVDTSYDPGALDPDTTYYWRVDEFKTTGIVTGPVWSFSTIGLVEPADIPDLIAGYQFEEDASSLSALDMSVNAFHGTLIGDASIAGAVLNLDGNGDCVDLGNDPVFNFENDFSISVWVKMNSWGGGWGNVIVGKRGESGVGWQLRRFSGDNRFSFTTRGTGNDDYPRSSIEPSLNEWHHLAAVRDGDQKLLYIDGNLDSTADINTDPVNPSDHNVYIGARANGGNSGPEAFFDGDIDDVHIYSRVLTSDEIRLMGADLTIAWSPDPASGASGLSASTTVLSWNPGEGAQQQDVYLGTDAAAVAAATAIDTTGIYRGRQAETTYTPDDLVWDATFYWRVDQVSVDGSTTCIATGSVWSFNTPVLVPADADLGAPISDVSGFLIHSLKPQDATGWGYNAMNEIFDTGLWNGLPAAAGSEGTRIDEFVNLRDTGNGAFSEANGYPDAAYPGIDPEEVPAQDPAAGDDDNDFGTEILGTIQLTAGMHTIGANSDDGTIIVIGGVEVARTGEWKGASNEDFSFYVEADGHYNLRARTMEGGGGASVELHEILADGTRILLNDVANGGSAVFAPVPLYVEDFESYAAGDELHGVGGWAGWDGDAGAGAPVSDAFASSGTNSVEVIGTADLVQEFDIAGGIWTFSAMQYIPSGTTGTTYFILMNQYGAADDWSTQTTFDLAAGTVTFWGGETTWILYDHWVELKLVIDLDNNTVDEYYNGILFSTHEWDDTQHNTLGALDLYGAGASSVYYDDITVSSL